MVLELTKVTKEKVENTSADGKEQLELIEIVCLFVIHKHVIRIRGNVIPLLSLKRRGVKIPRALFLSSRNFA